MPISAVVSSWYLALSTLSTGEAPLTVRFAPASLKLQACDLVISRRYSHLQASRALPSFWLLFLLAGDIELNPGPRHWKYPCGICSGPVKSNQRGVQCDVCAYWLHARCIGLSSEEYAELQRSDDPWCCSKCQKESLPFFDVSNSDSIFNTSDSIFNTSTADSPGDTEPTTSTSSHPPLSLTVFYTNCRSLLPKIDHIRLLASVHQPHIISICETWLDESISNDEVFIPGFTLIRRDRNRHGGGIAIFIYNSVRFTILLKHPSIELLLV